MNLDKEFWYFLIQGELDQKTSAFANFYSYGEHCGDAYSKAERIAKEEGLLSPMLIETCRLDTLKDFALPAEAIQVDKDSYRLPEFYTYELDENENAFVLPTGVSFGTNEGEYETDLITESFVAFNKNEDGIFEFELVADISNLIDTFLNAINFLPSVDGFWMYLLDHWDETTTELWVGNNLASKEGVRHFLAENEESTLKNGFVDIVVHCLKGDTHLILDEHKKIQLHTKNEELFQGFVGDIMDLGFEQTQEYYTIDDGYYHWHYRPANSLDKPGLIEMLGNHGFEKIEK